MWWDCWGFAHQAVTHLTGTASLPAASVAAWDAGAAWHFALVIGSFVAGTVMSGYIIQDSTLKLGRRYGVALLMESLLLGIAVPLLQHNQQPGIYCASCACGLFLTHRIWNGPGFPISQLDFSPVG